MKEVIVTLNTNMHSFNSAFLILWLWLALSGKFLLPGTLKSSVFFIYLFIYFGCFFIRHSQSEHRV